MSKCNNYVINEVFGFFSVAVRGLEDLNVAHCSVRDWVEMKLVKFVSFIKK